MSNRNSSVKTGQLRGQGQAHITSTQSSHASDSHEHGKFNREQIKKLKSLLGTLEKPLEIGIYSLAFKSEFPSLYAQNVSCTTFSNS